MSLSYDVNYPVDDDDDDDSCGTGVAFRFVSAQFCID